MKPKLYRLLLLVGTLVGIALIIYSGYTATAPTEIGGTIVRKVFWELSPFKILGVLLLIIAYRILHTKSIKKNNT